MATQLATVGWREWVSLPQLEIPEIKAKVDTGAKTSCLHAFDLEPYEDNGVEMIKFLVHPIQKRNDIVKECHAVVADKRRVSDSGGHRELRYVIMTRLKMGDMDWDIEMTLTDRDTMLFRMLLGRTAMKNRLTVNPALSYLVGKKPE